MRFGLSELFTGEHGRDVGLLRDAAVLAEELGFETMWFAEHLVMAASYDSRYPYSRAGARD